MIIDGKCYQSTDESEQCIEEKDQKEEDCEKYLQDVSEEMVKTSEGGAFDQLCEVEIEIPVDSPQGFLENLWYSVKCFFLRLFGGGC